MRRRLRFVVIVVVVGVAALDSCADKTNVGEAETTNATVTGTITWKRGWGATEFPRPDSSYFGPRPLVGVKVSLLEYQGEGQPPGVSVVSVATDSLGAYEITAAPGPYYLAIHAAKYGGIVVDPNWIDPAEEVGHLKVVQLQTGKVIVRDVVVMELVPQ